MPVCCGGYNLGKRGPLLRAQVVLVASLLILGGCGGDDDTDTEDDGNATSMAITDSNAVDAGSTAGSDTAAATVVGDSTAAATTLTVPVRLGDRFAWCESVQRRWDTQVYYRAEAEAAALAHEAAVGLYEAASDDLDRAEAQEALDRASADYASAASDYGKTRWGTAGLIVGDMSSLLASDRDDVTLQVAIERAFEAFRSNAGADTLAAFDSAQEATDTLELVSSVDRFGVDEPVEAGEVAAPEPVVFDASEAWLMAIEALEEALEAAGGR